MTLQQTQINQKELRSCLKNMVCGYLAYIWNAKSQSAKLVPLCVVLGNFLASNRSHWFKKWSKWLDIFAFFSWNFTVSSTLLNFWGCSKEVSLWQLQLYLWHSQGRTSESSGISQCKDNQKNRSITQCDGWMHTVVVRGQRRLSCMLNNSALVYTNPITTSHIATLMNN